MCLEGDPATHVFVLVTGWVKIVSVTRDGKELVLALRGQGDIIGELAAEESGHRTATARTISTVRSLTVAYDTFMSFLGTHPSADLAYRHVLAQRWSEAAAELRSRLTTTGAQRLAGRLAALAARHGVQSGDAVEIQMPLSQEELASLVGASRATVARATHEWRRRGLIRTGRRHIAIVDLDKLKRIAASGQAQLPQPRSSSPFLMRFTTFVTSTNNGQFSLSTLTAWQAGPKVLMFAQEDISSAVARMNSTDSPGDSARPIICSKGVGVIRAWMQIGRPPAGPSSRGAPVRRWRRRRSVPSG